MPPDSRLTSTPDGWDVVLRVDADDTNPLTMMAPQDGESWMWEGVDAPSLATDQAVYREMAVMWKPSGVGAGHGIRLPETTGAGPDGQIVSQGTSYGEFVTEVVPGIVMPAGKMNEVDIPASITSAGGRIFDALEYGASKDLWFTTGMYYMLKIPSGSGTPEIGPQNLGGSFTSGNLVNFDGKMYISGAGSGPIWELDGTTWTQAAANCEASRVDKVNWNPSNQIMGGSGGGTSADHLILTDASGNGFYHVVSGNDAKVFANWISAAGSPIPVGDSNYPIQNIVSSPRVVWFAKPNGLHGVTETGRTVNLTPWIERTYHESNGGCVTFFSDDERAIVFYAHQHGLVAVTVNGSRQESARFVQFGARSPNQSPIWGRPRWMTPHVDGLFVAYFDGTDSYIMRLILDKDGGYRWSGAEAVIRDEEVTYMKVTSPGGAPRLWIATVETGTTTPHLYWQSQPHSGNPYIDWQAGTSHEFSTEWSVYLPRDDGGSSAYKVIRRYDMVVQNADDGNTVTVDASADDGAYVDQGTVSTSPRASFIATTYTRGVNFNWRLRCQNSASSPLVLESFQARMSMLPEQSDVFTIRVLLAAGQGIQNGAEDLQDPFTVRRRLRGYQRLGPVQWRSFLSREFVTVKVEQGLRTQAVWSRKYACNILVGTFSLSVLEEPTLYDAGDSYDIGAEYGGGT